MKSPAKKTVSMEGPSLAKKGKCRREGGGGEEKEED